MSTFLTGKRVMKISNKYDKSWLKLETLPEMKLTVEPQISISIIKNAFLFSLLVLCEVSNVFGQSRGKEIPQKPVLKQSAHVDSQKLVEKQLDKIDNLFASVPYWLSTVYDWKSGGFYDNYTMKISPEFDADIQSTRFGWKTLVDDGYIYKNPGDVPEMIRTKIVKFIRSRQDSTTGYFLDPLYKEEMKKSDRTMGRMLGMATGVLHDLGVEPLYPLPGAREEKNRPAHLQSVEKYKTWLAAQNWDRVWTAFGHILSQGSAISTLPESLRDSIVSVTYSYVKKHQTKDGLWGENQDIAVKIGGADKIGGFLNKFDKTLPHPDRIFETLINWFQSSPPLTSNVSGCTICIPRNAITVLKYIQPHLSHPISYKDKLTILKQSFRFMNYYKMADGGFPKTRKEFILAPDDIHMGKTKIEQSDINGTHLMINMRSSLYKMCGIHDSGLPNKKDFMNYLPNYKFSK